MYSYRQTQKLEISHIDKWHKRAVRDKRAQKKTVQNIEAYDIT